MKKVNYIQLVQEIGSGGTASVLLGIDTYTGFPVAVKVLQDFGGKSVENVVANWLKHFENSPTCVETSGLERWMLVHFVRSTFF